MKHLDNSVYSTEEHFLWRVSKLPA